MKRLIIFVSTALIMSFFLIFFVYLKYDDGKMHLVICDVGQGDAIFIRTPEGADILIDGGPDKKVLECLSDNMPFWDRTLEVVILTHPDSDHLTGVVDVIKRYKVIKFLTQSRPGKTDIYQLFTNVLADKKLSANHLSAGDKLILKSGVSLKVLWPKEVSKTEIAQKVSNVPLNESSVIILLKYENFEALLTGDAGSQVMDMIAEEAGDIDVLKVPHHGSKTGMSSHFLNSIDAEIAIISSGKNNRYNHPAEESLDLLSKANVKTYKTDDLGQIEIVSDGMTHNIEY